jgi:peptidyl-prolyl cis-trans isomerase A (cyclophilin A)
MPMLNRREFCHWTVTAGVAGGALPLIAATVAAQDKDKASKPEDIPTTFQVKFETSKGDVLVEVHRDWSPHGAARFYDAVKTGFYNDCRFFRVVPGFMVQWGINGDPKVQDKWRDANIPDDRPTGENRKSNKRGFITYAKSGRPNSRTTQLFINYGNNSRLDADGFTPFGEVIEGMDVVDKINAKHGERPNQGAIQEQGNAYLNKQFSDLDYIKKATIVENSK